MLVGSWPPAARDGGSGNIGSGISRGDAVKSIPPSCCSALILYFGSSSFFSGMRSVGRLTKIEIGIKLEDRKSTYLILDKGTSLGDLRRQTGMPAI